MQTEDFNPDPRPLPAGWTQHFEPAKQLWYYVQMSVTPPKVSFTHPIDIVPLSRGAQLAVPPIQTSRNPSQSGSKLTFAQQLYASSMSSSMSPMTNSQSVPTFQLPSIRNRNLPTPPPSSSPPPGTGAYFTNVPSNGSDRSLPVHQTLSHTIKQPSANFNSVPYTETPFLNPLRMNTQTPILSNNSHPQRQRASTGDPGTPQRSVNVSPSMAGSRPTRHLVTMARPPDQRSPSALSPLFLEPPAAAHPAPAVPSPPPASSILFSQTPGTTLTSPLTPPSTAHQPQSIGRVTGVGSLASDVISALQSALLTPGTGVDQFSLQAVVQGRPDANYQRIINALIKLHQQQQQQVALMKLQMQQPPPPTIDFKILITEVQKVQTQQIATTQQQQQQLAQLHANAQLQGAQQQQQQPRTAAQQYQALVQQRYQQQAAAQQQTASQQQQLQQQQQQQQQAFAQQQQQQQAAQYQALLQQQQEEAAALAQQDQALLNNAARPPQHQPQQTLQSTIKPYLQAYKIFEDLNIEGNAGDNGGGDGQFNHSGGGGLLDNASGSASGLFSGGNFGAQDPGGFDFMSVSFNQDNSGGFGMNFVDTFGQSN